MWLKQQGYDQIYTKPVLLSVAQMEATLKGEFLDIDDFVTIGFGQPTIAPEKDKRPSVDKNQSAKQIKTAAKVYAMLPVKVAA